MRWSSSWITTASFSAIKRVSTSSFSATGTPASQRRTSVALGSAPFQGWGRRGCDLDEVFVEAKELGEALERSAELAQAGGDGGSMSSSPWSTLCAEWSHPR